LFPAIVVGCIALFAFTARFAGSIKGSVSPADAAVRVWALSASDTVKADIMGGLFELPNVKPGTYKVMVEANPPYQNITKENVAVTDGQTVDLGVIKLSK
jgi:hypothetical protein